jgi:hypothetical protein
MKIIIESLNIEGTFVLETKKSFLENLKIEIACDNWFEVCIDRTKIAINEISIRFELEKDTKVVQTLPGFGALRINLSDDYSHNWFV